MKTPVLQRHLPLLSMQKLVRTNWSKLLSKNWRIQRKVTRMVKAQRMAVTQERNLRLNCHRTLGQRQVAKGSRRGRETGKGREPGAETMIEGGILTENVDGMRGMTMKGAETRFGRGFIVRGTKEKILVSITLVILYIYALLKLLFIRL